MPPPAILPDAPIPLLSSIAPLAGDAAAWLVDIWGVIHNGVRPFDAACAACVRLREAGGIVVLVSNSPRPNAAVARQLDAIGVPRQAWDAIVTSGDVARTLIGAYAGRALFHIGPERDLPIFEGLAVTRVPLASAEAVVCTGLFDDEREGPNDYAETLAQCAARGLPMICANPDIMVERGGRMIYCAGALAEAYAALGGVVEFAGKPYLPIYRLTLETLQRLQPGTADKARLFAIGDGIRTDIAGAAAAGLRSVFVASGVHVKGGLTAEAIAELFPPGTPRPVAAMPQLAW